MMIRFLLFILIPVFLFSQNPDPTTIAGSQEHDGSGSVSGQYFGTKSPAAPLIWDDCEGKTVDNDAAVISSGWSDPWPIVVSSPDSTKIRYRTNGFRSMDQAHSNSLRFLSGCHYQDADNNPQYIGTGAEGFRAVMVTIDAGVGQTPNRWYTRFYYKVDDLWNRQEMTLNNHKITIFQEGGAGYTGGFQYTVYENGAAGQSPGVSSLHDNELEPSSNEFNNARLKWVIWEETLNTGDSDRNVYIDNTDVGFSTSYPQATARSFTMGGYYRRVTDGGSILNTADYRGGWEGDQDTNWRYFDDAYVDTTWSRVMVGNASTWDACTILEPQICTSWSSTLIEFTVNLGNLPTNKYLYVVNSDNEVNANGLPFESTGSINKLAPGNSKITPGNSKMF